MQRLTICSAKGNFTVVASLLAGHLNLLADSTSRSQIDEFRALAPSAEKSPAPVQTSAKMTRKNNKFI